jgi:hypothetical protein
MISTWITSSAAKNLENSMQTPIWICADGTEILLSEMSGEHVRNALLYLQLGTGDLGPMLRSGCSGFSNREWTFLMSAELRRRSHAFWTGDVLR